jgi:hypothetical protein
MSKGFQDVSGEYPKRQTKEQSGVNPAARGIKSEESRTTGRRGPRVSSSTAQIASRAVSEPGQVGAPQYPYNHVTETASGHRVELDDTPGRERVSIQHRTGAKIEMRPDGSVTVRSANNLYQIVAGDKDAIIRGSVNIVVESNADIRVKGDTNMQCDGDLNTLVQGNYNLEVQGDYNVRIHGNETVKTTGGELHETRGNVIRRNLSNYTVRTVGDDRSEIGGSMYNTVEGEIHEMSYGPIQASYCGGMWTVNGNDATGSPGVGRVQVANIENTVKMDGAEVALSKSIDVTGPAKVNSVEAATAKISTTTGNLVGQATHAVNSATILPSIAALSSLSLPSLQGLAGGLGQNILNNIGVGVLGDLQGQLSSITDSVRGGIMDNISSAYSSIGNLSTELSNITNISGLTGAIQNFGFDYNVSLDIGELSSISGIESTISNITDLTSTDWFTNTAQYHELLTSVSQNIPKQQAVSAARAALEKATELGIDEATVAASSAFSSFTSIASIESDVNGFVSALGDLPGDVQSAAQQSITDAAESAASALTAEAIGTLSSVGDVLHFSGVVPPSPPSGPVVGPTSSEQVVPVKDTSDPFILALDRQAVTGYNTRMLNTYEVVARARNKSLRTDSEWLQDQLDQGAILSTISNSSPPPSLRTGQAVSTSSGVHSVGQASAGSHSIALYTGGELPVPSIPVGVALTEGISRSSQLSPNFNVSHMLSGDSLTSNLISQGGLSVPRLAQNMQLLSYNVLERLRDKYGDTWTISEGLYNLLPNEKIDSSSITMEMFKGYGVGIQLVTQPNSYYFEVAQWIRNNMVFDKLVLSYIDYDPAQINEPTILITVRPGDNRRQVSTEFNHVKVVDNIVELDVA